MSVKLDKVRRVENNAETYFIEVNCSGNAAIGAAKRKYREEKNPNNKIKAKVMGYVGNYTIVVVTESLTNDYKDVVALETIAANKEVADRVSVWDHRADSNADKLLGRFAGRIHSTDGIDANEVMNVIRDQYELIYD